MVEKIKAILAKHLRVDASELREDANLIEDLGADSLDTVEILMALEETFNIEIPDEVAMKFKTINDLVAYIEKVKK